MLLIKIHYTVSSVRVISPRGVTPTVSSGHYYTGGKSILQCTGFL
ncbi:hypothetical protein VPHD239_0117 [Vibrio phage D239]